MRNELNDIEKIERYLRNEMSSEERISFEKEMQNNPDLRRSVEEQKELLKGMERMKMKNDISKGKFKYRLQKGLVNVGIPIVITAAITALIINWSSKKDNSDVRSDSDMRQSDSLTYELPELNETGDSLWADADKYIPYQIYPIDAQKDTVITGKDGMVVAIPANSFVDENGNVVKGKIDFELKEALNTETILKGGLSTTSNGELLETGGMFYINARQNGKSLKIAEGKNIYADVPSDPTKTGMMLFEGERLADGNINWVNPKTIEKPLVPVDIHSLNFYPPLYEDSLAKMGKDVANKKYKDSLYYSFAGRFGNKNEQLSIDAKKVIADTVALADPFSIEEVKAKTDSEIFGERFFNKNCASCHKPNDDYTGPALKGARKRWKNAGYENKIYDWVQNPLKLIEEKNPYAVSLQQKWKYSGIMPAHNLSKFEIRAIFDYVDSYPSAAKDLAPTFSGLNPAKVKSIWNDKFQNTLIATKEFEERMPYIHKLCSRGNNVLDMYVKNIDKKICTIDSMVANTLSGADKEQFLKFAARGEGRVKTDDNCLKKLGNFYDEQTKIYTEAAKKTSEEYYEKNRKQNEESDKRNNEQSITDAKRNSDNFNKEFTINIIDAYRQIGKKPNIVNGRVRLSVGTTGWKNLDRYVLEATLNRTTMNYTDPETGKKAILKYEPLSIKIKDVEKYDRVLVYLLPDQLNSFMRMKKEGDSYTEKLNMLFKHEIIVLAYKGEEAFFKHIKDVQPGELSDISLEKMSQSEINANLSSLNKLQHTDEMQKDVSHQFFLQADQKRRKVFLEKEKFIRRIERVIFPCGNETEEMPTTWPAVIKQEF